VQEESEKEKQKMRYYKGKNPYIPHELFMQAVYLIKDYDRIKAEYDAIPEATSTSDGQPRGSGISDTTQRKALKREQLSHRIKAIDDAANLMPEEYRKHIINNIKYEINYPLDYANKNTWTNWKKRFILGICERMYWI